MEGIGFQVDPYNSYITNCIINSRQQTVVWYVDNIKSSHVGPEVNRKFLKWLDDGIGKVKSTEGNIHKCLGMKLLTIENYKWI